MLSIVRLVPEPTGLYGALHGHAIAVHIQRQSDDMLRVDHGSRYPALYRLKKRGWIASSALQRSWPATFRHGEPRE